MMAPRDSYRTVYKGTRHEYREKRCGLCGNTQTYVEGQRPGPCPYRAIHARLGHA